MSRIRILPENVANKIAAGEVVERPASVVKELLENALDAGARSVRVETESGGKRLIRVIDDGYGMNHDDALLAFERHATSKLRTADDLLSISTLGFRGEALPSIASVSRLVLETRAADAKPAPIAEGVTGAAGAGATVAASAAVAEPAAAAEAPGPETSVAADAAPPAGATTTPPTLPTLPPSSTQPTPPPEQGTRIEFAGGKLIRVKPAGVPPGTSISVADLFYCVPARRKFLKSETTELGHIASLVTHYALAHPEVHFILKTPSQEILNCAPVDRLADRVYQIFGRQALDELIEIPAVEGPVRAAITEPSLEADEQPGTLRVTGFTSRPEVQRPNRNGIYIFVNRRLVRDRLLLHAISEAYRNVTPPGVFPVVLLFLDLPYAEVDVNVHPAKIEVRFRHPNFVHDFTRDALRQALANARPIPGFPSAARAAAAAISGDTSQFAPGIAAAAGAAIGANEFIGPPRGELPASFIPGAAGSDSAMGPDFELSGAPDRPIPQRLQFGASAAADFPLPSRFSAAGGAVAHALEAPDSCVSSAVEGMPGSLRAAEAPATLPSPEQIADLKPLGQVNNSFIIAVNGEGLWIIDQHVAHERVLFEQHREARRTGELGGQRMLVPLLVELNPRQMATFDQIAEELRANGFEAELMGSRSVAIQAAPAGIAVADAQKLLFEILDGVARENQAISIDSLQSKIAASTACHAAIKVNTPLDSTKMEWLLGELAKTEHPMSCPHGRPVVLRYSVREIERAFKRI
jgi:DNA mismatch repair protein MutL